MNDLAEQALRTADNARRAAASTVARRPSVWLAAGGFVAACLIVVAGGRIGTVKSVIPLTSWFGLLSRNGVASDSAPAVLMLLGTAGLVLLWVGAVRVLRPGRVETREVWWVFGAWAAPFVVGPPLMSNDIYSYVAIGLMQRHGYDVYTNGPSVLGPVRALSAVDPAWRDVGSPYGTVATLAQHLSVAVSGGNPLGAVIVLRGLALASTVAIGLLAVQLAGPRQVQALTLTVLNPLLLLQVVSAGHMEGLMCALVLAALVAANQRRWVLALVLACAAGEVKAPAFVAVLAIVVYHASGRPRRAALRSILRDGPVAVLSFAVMSVLVRDGLGWIRNLETPALGHTPLAPASLLGDMFGPIVRSASFDDLATGGRIAAILASVCIVAYLVLTAGRRSLNRTTGYALLALGLLSPVLYPWYLLWGIVCLAPTARAARRDWLVLGSAIACLYTPPGFNRMFSSLIPLIALGIGLLILWPRIRARVLLADKSGLA